MRVAVVGARRARQGTGPFVIRELLRLGCAVPGIVGTRPESLAAAQAELRAAHGIEVAGFTDLRELLDATPVDAVAICSPSEAHLPQLEAAVAAGCHVFCEKPLWWAEGLESDLEALRARAEALVDAFRSAGRSLVLNTQWPHTLPAFDELYPGVREAPPARFEMWMSPISLGPAMLVDSGSHLLSMLHALAPGPGALESVSVTHRPEGLDLACVYAHPGGATDVAFRLRRCPDPPRPVGYGIDGNLVQRRVDLPDYRIYFRTYERELRIRDPLEASVEAFVAAAGAAAPPDLNTVPAMVQLAQLVAAARETAP